MSDTPFIGEIKLFGGNFQISGHAFCDGQLVAISQNDALFALIGTTYGGDGQTTFALPDLRGRIPVHMGQGPGLSNYVIGQLGGTETVTLTQAQLPSHSHFLLGSTATANTTNPTNNNLAAQPALNQYATYTSGPVSPLNAASLTVAGGNQPHENLQPYLVINYLIALFGIFPSRN